MVFCRKANLENFAKFTGKQQTPLKVFHDEFREIFQNYSFTELPRATHCTKMKFFIKDFFSKCDPDLVTFTEEILNRKLHFLCSDCS